MASRCTPPKSIPVKAHHRWVRKTRKKKRATGARRVKSGQAYYVVTNGRSTCGHHHRTLSAAIACAKRKRRSESNLRARYGKAHVRSDWHTQHKTAA